MDEQTTISITNLSKTFKLFVSKYDFIKEAIHPLRKRYHSKFHALKNISFNVNKGEVIGIVGKNGSGKSTLLKVLASVVTPTEGKCICKGRVTALLELSGGFHRDLTGIENIKFLGALHGFSKSEMGDQILKILEFAEIGEYAYQPIKTYSSGMYMRLAFSLAISIKPEILVIDEVLAVGDLKFRKKCLQKIQEFKEEGKTIVICTHSTSLVNDFCTRALWIHEGSLKDQGLPKVVTKKYNEFMTSQKPSRPHK